VGRRAYLHGYAAALKNAKPKRGAPLPAEVQADQRLCNVLGVYQKSCTRVRGRSVLRSVCHVFA
jgi:hypothetical protein